MLVDVFGEGAGSRRCSDAMPVQGDGAEVRGLSEEVRGRVNHFASLWVTESFSVLVANPVSRKTGRPFDKLRAGSFDKLRASYGAPDSWETV